MFPLALDLSSKVADGIAVAVARRVLGFSEQASNVDWPTRSADREWTDAH
jgi:hypothetical protein